MRWPWQPPGDEKEVQAIAEQLIAHLMEQANELQTRAERLQHRAQQWRGHHA